MNDFVIAIQKIVEETQHNLYFICLVLAVMWGVFIFTKLTNNRLLILGVYPRHAFGLVGIICSPFLHANFNHLFFNSIPFFVLSDFVLIEGLDVYFQVSIYIILISGILTWTFARSALHVGASSLITGYWSYLILNTYSQGGIIAIFLAIICVYFFAGIFFGIFPREKGVSWEGHLFGLLAGLLTSYGLYLGLLPAFTFQ